MNASQSATALTAAIDMPHIPLRYLFLYFLCYACIGWLCEEVWCTVHFRKVVKRGMLHGPVCPIYGFGALLILYLLYPWRATFVRLYLASVVVTSILEYATSWVLERLFHAKWWDYSGQPLNLNGRCCLLNSCAFGVAGLALEHLIHPLVTDLLYLPALEPYIGTACMVLGAVLVADLLVTVHKLVDMSTTLAALKAYGESLRVRFEEEEWFRPESLRSMVESVSEHARQSSGAFTKRFLDTFARYNRRERTVEFWLRKFPTLSSRDYAHPLAHLKALAEQGQAMERERRARRKAASPSAGEPSAEERQGTAG